MTMPRDAREVTRLADCLDRDGFVCVTDVLSTAVLDELRAAFAAPVESGAGGIRNILSNIPAARQVAVSPALRNLLRDVTGEGAGFRPVRGILFDKTADGVVGANWKVPFHQDLSVAVQARPSTPTPGYTAWSVKEGVPHVQPPRDVLERLVTARLHLDPCDEETGALRVLPGSHRHGRLSADDIARHRVVTPEVVCATPEGERSCFAPCSRMRRHP